ncbi:deoxynucleoside kinase [candidate division CSSED10-310 bacterium]|uniref:Deoxynucleoside kinase n=1 Tax=candidate division CSSED10-310 bacterium TaxID=2855610 RepID=A0ABV6Z4P4_UNCC1
MNQEGNLPKQGLFITVDANIGAGKTNACHAITSAAMSSGWQARVLEEPTNHPKFAHFLSRYYDDLRTGNNTGGGFCMQMFMLCQRYEQHRLAVELAWGEQGIAVVQDRPIYGDTAFATTAMERGFMTKEEYELYVDVFRNMSRDVMPPDIFVFLDVPPEECHRRMATRGREQEEGVPLDYLQHLDKNYKLLIREMRRRGVRVMVVDWKDFGPPVELWKSILRMVVSAESWYEQLTFSFAKQPRMPIMTQEPEQGAQAEAKTEDEGESAP